MSNKAVNDDKEHQLRIWRKGRHGEMIIDDEETIVGSSFGILAMLNVDGDVYIGEISIFIKC